MNEQIIFISVLIIIPMLLCAILHYAILHKLWHKKNSFIIGFYALTAGATGLLIYILSKTVRYFSSTLKAILQALDQGNWVLLYIELITIILLIFSPYFFSKPVKETWKSILLAGILAGVIAYGLEEYFLRNFFAMQ